MSRVAVIKATGTKVSGGRYESFNGIGTYIIGEVHKQSRILLSLADVLGNKVINTQLVADQFSENGFYVVI